MLEITIETKNIEEIFQFWADAEKWNGQIIKLWKNSETLQNFRSTFQKQKKLQKSIDFYFCRENSFDFDISCSLLEEEYTTKKGLTCL